MVSSSIAGPAGSNGWFTGPVELTLQATDEEGGSGIGSLTYQVGAAEPVTTEAATVTLPFGENGIRTVKYSAEDFAGNPSEQGSVAIKIDPLPPTPRPTLRAACSVGQAIPTHLQCGDTLSGVAGCDGPPTTTPVPPVATPRHSPPSTPPATRPPAPSSTT